VYPIRYILLRRREKGFPKNGELAQAFDSNEDLHRAVRINELEEEDKPACKP
jgi:hypothetical protein